MRQTKTIGSILLDVELVTQQDIDQALELQKQTGKRLGEVLVQLGAVSDDDIRWALAEQLNLPYVNIRKDQVDVDVATLLPEKLARRYHVIPILKIDRELTVVVDDPLNTTIIQDIERITKSEVKISLGRTSDILLAIDEIYGSSEEHVQSKHDTPPVFLSSWFQEGAIQKILNDPSGQVMLDQILYHAFEHGVPRIYLQSGLETCTVSYKMNGVLQEQIHLSTEWSSILLFRLKINADIDLTQTQHPQYQEVTYTISPTSLPEGQPSSAVTLAVSILPTASGESAVIQVINKPAINLWEELRNDADSELQERELQDVYAFQEQLRHRKTGTIFLGGTSYSDKITTLYALLHAFDPVRKKIVTLESSSEYRVDKYSQIRYAKNIHGVAFSRTVQSTDAEDNRQPDQKFQALLSHKPELAFSGNTSTILQPAQQELSSWLHALNPYELDVLLVDHLESDIVVSQCFDLAGHALLLAGLDFPNVFHILAYFQDCHVKPSMLVSRLQGLLAQQAVRTLCPTCKQKDNSSSAKELVERYYGEGDAPLPEIYAPGQCPECHMTGYRQYVILFEVLPMASWLKDLLLTGAPLSEIQQMAGEQGFQTLTHKALHLLQAGITSVEEVYSIIQ